MQSNNPILTRAEPYADYHQPMTINGVIRRSTLLLSISSFVGISLFILLAFKQNLGLAYTTTMVGAIGSLVLGLITTFKGHTAPKLAVPYALFEGAFLGGISSIFQAKYPGVPLQALLATFVTTVVMFTLYKRRIIRATEKFKSVVLSASLAIFVVFLAQFVLKIAFGSSIPYIFESNWLGIGFAAFVAVFASLELILDFDLIENAVEQKVAESFEWNCAISLLATLVWMYFSFLRLIGLLSDD